MDSVARYEQAYEVAKLARRKSILAVVEKLVQDVYEQLISCHESGEELYPTVCVQKDFSLYLNNKDIEVITDVVQDGLAKKIGAKNLSSRYELKINSCQNKLTARLISLSK